MKYRKGDFVIVPNLDAIQGQKPEAQLLYMWLCTFVNEEGNCYPSRRKLSQKSGLSVRTVDKYMDVLVEIGVVQKIPRKMIGKKANLSNLYQIIIPERELIVSVDTPENTRVDTPENTRVDTPENTRVVSSDNTLTISNITIPKRTINTLRVLDTPEEEKPTLPISRGKTDLLRLISIYSDLFFNVYGFKYKVNFGRDSKIFKGLLQNYTEIQIARLLIIFFNWNGMGGNDGREYDKLSGATFHLAWFKSCITQYETYSRNVLKENFDDDQELLTNIKNYFLKVIHK